MSAAVIPAVALMINADEVWFDAHPDRRMRLRPAGSAERDVAKANGFQVPRGEVLYVLAITTATRRVLHTYVEGKPGFDLAMANDFACAVLLQEVLAVTPGLAEMLNAAMAVDEPTETLH